MNLTTPISQAESSLLAAIVLDFEGTRADARAIDPRWISDSVFARRALQVAQEWRSEVDGTLTLQGLEIALRRSLESESEAITGWVSGLSETPAAPANVRAYGEILRKDWERRQLRELTGEVFTALGEMGADVDALLARLNAGNELVLTRRRTTISGTDAIMRAEELEARGITPVSTGFPDLDSLLRGGLRPGDYAVIAGRPSMGKSALLVDVARAAALNGKRIGYMTLEMTPEQLATRMAATGRPECLSNVSFSMPYSPTMRALETEVARWKADGYDLIVVDYLGLVYPNAQFRSRYESVTEVSHAMKRLALQSQLPILCAHQLSRGVVGREGKRPMLSDLRDSGAVEEDADIVGLVHRPGYYEGDNNRPEAWLYLDKHRNGETGDVRLFWRRRPSPGFSSYANFPG